jgi:hypothetical protein
MSDKMDSRLEALLVTALGLTPGGQLVRPVIDHLIKERSNLKDALVKARQEEVRLEDEVERLRGALEPFVTFHSGHVLPPELVRWMDKARAALDPTTSTENNHE